jgi:FimV-like protein
MVACMNLGLIAKKRRDLATATSWYRQVIDSGHDNAGLAAAHLGELGYLLGDSVTASRYYGQSLALTDDGELVAEAAFRLGEIRYHDGDRPAAIGLLHQAVSTGEPDFAEQAAALLKQIEAAS